jgi:hypothetical protein
LIEFGEMIESLQGICAFIFALDVFRSRLNWRLLAYGCNLSPAISERSNQ